MKIKKDQVDRLSHLLLEHYKSKGLTGAPSNPAAVASKISDIIAKNFAEEEEIEQEARRILASHGQSAKEIDPYRMFVLTKQKVARLRGFIL
jgi:hypothetical protein